MTPAGVRCRIAANKSGSVVDVPDIVRLGSTGLFDAIFRSSGLICHTGLKSLHDEVFTPSCRLQSEDESDSSPPRSSPPSFKTCAANGFFFPSYL